MGRLSELFSFELCTEAVHSHKHTQMSSSYSSLDLVLSHWAHLTVRTAYMLYYCEHGGMDLMGLKPSS